MKKLIEFIEKGKPLRNYLEHIFIPVMVLQLVCQLYYFQYFYLNVYVPMFLDFFGQKIYRGFINETIQLLYGNLRACCASYPTTSCRAAPASATATPRRLRHQPPARRRLVQERQPRTDRRCRSCRRATTGRSSTMPALSRAAVRAMAGR